MMLLTGFLRVLLYSLLLQISSTASSDVPVQLNDDVLGLIVFKSNLHDPVSYLESWSEDDDSPCSWKFVECNPVTGRVSKVSLDNLGLSGKIGRGLEKLQQLKVLSMSSNNISGNISPQLALVNSLESLNLSHNSLSGRIPSSMSNIMSSIRFLDLSENSISGPVPDDLFQSCSSLRSLSLARNRLEGSIPSTLPKCSSLNSLNLSNNHFSGDPGFGSGIWSLSRLRTLDLSHNSLSGLTPKGVSAIHNLKELYLQSNQFSGPLPGDIGLCLHINKMDLSNNFYAGNLPESLRRLTSMTFFSSSNNMLTGEFPEWIVNMSSLEHIDLSNNGFTGSLPSSIGDLKSLKHLSLSQNAITGNIPKSLIYSTELSVIRLRGNNVNGSIPEGLFDLGLEEVDFADNSLMGSIPPCSSRIFESLRILDLSRNKLSGEIPAEMGLFSNLKYLNFSWNRLRSRMPPELSYIQNLTVLDLRSNGLYGSIPKNICDSASLGILQLDGNSLTGPIPEEIGNCSSLYLLSLSHNNLSGSIPISISDLKNLNILKLEFNELSGEIPQELGKLENLLAVNISYNRLIGRLPVEGVFQTLDASALQGNLGICSPLLTGPCKMNVPKPLVLDPYAYNNQINGHKHRKDPSNSMQDHKHRNFFSASAIVSISAAILIAIGVIVISLLNVSAQRRLAFVENVLESMCSSSSRSGNENLATGKLVWFDSISSSPDLISSNPQSLLNKASEIGEGVFGTTYKVSLERKNLTIKKLFTSNLIQNPEDFDTEVRILGKARHPNLISLTGYYWTPELQLLVSDFALNGSLQSKLHERLPSAQPLSWPNRFKILLGAAKGLTYLHSLHPPIIHYNIKPTNILLDENFNPKISDFGLARLMSKHDVNHGMSNRFQSALGYPAPELACRSLKVNEKCDVYGYGVMILEVVTGRRPVEFGEDNVVILREHVRKLLEEGNVLKSVDGSMGEYPEKEVLPVLKLALVCTSQIPSSRPSMAEVVHILEVIKEAF